MRIRIVGSKGFQEKIESTPFLAHRVGEPRSWYEEYIGLEVDAELKIHSTFGYEEFILTDSTLNREQFQYQPIALLRLNYGSLSIDSKDAIIL